MKEIELVERIIDLSRRALMERSREKFADFLKERTELIAALNLKSLEAEEVLLKTWLDIEQKILNRLEKERQEVLREMDSLSKRRTATHHYSLRPSFPQTPAFVDKIG